MATLPTTTNECYNSICSCGSGGACGSGLTCQGAQPAGSCVAGNGATCTTDPQCSSGHCVDGHCCGVASCGTCKACTGAGGTCVNQAPGAPGNGRPGGGTPCPSVCTAGTGNTPAKVAAAACNGNGSCTNGPGVNCANGTVKCNVAGDGCLANCASDADCITSDYCSSASGGTCTPRH